MMTDPIADLMVRIQNAARRGHATVMVPASKLKAEMLRVLKGEGFIGKVERDEKDGHPMLKIQLRYLGEGQPVITGMRRVSKPGKRVYVGKDRLPRVMGGMGIAILSTSKGVMTSQESHRANL